MDELTLTETYALAGLETIIERGLSAFFEVGSALLEIRENRLYRANYTTFGDYCRERWGMAGRTAYQFIDAALVVDNVRNLRIPVPANEAQARPLTGLEPEVQRIVWDVVQQTAPQGKVTATHVKSVVDVLKQVTITGALDNGEGESVRVADLLKAVITEETYERMKRQELHIQERAKPRHYVLKANRVRLQHYSAHMITFTIMDENVLELLMNAPTDLILSLWSELDE